MWRFLVFCGLLGAGEGQVVSPNIVEDAYNIFYNLPVTFQDCTVAQPAQLSDLVYILYKQENQDNGIILTDQNLDAVDPANRVIFIIPGWLENDGVPWVVQMKDTYLAQGPANVIVVNWSRYSSNTYWVAYCFVPQIGKFTGDLIYNLTVAVQLSLKLVQINGLSLGGQVAGFAGQEVHIKTKGKKIARINALEAAGPGYLGLPTDKRVDASDADFVQALHTNNNMFGYTYTYGTVDFQINDILPVALPIPVATPCGTLQPCCPTNPKISDITNLDELMSILFCSHGRVVDYFIASMTSTEFLGVPCTCGRFGLGLCKSFPTTIMGEHCPSTAKGELFLNPNAVPPYPKGQAGTGGVGGFVSGFECLLS